MLLHPAKERFELLKRHFTRLVPVVIEVHGAPQLVEWMRIDAICLGTIVVMEIIQFGANEDLLKGRSNAILKPIEESTSRGHISEGDLVVELC